MKPETFLKSPKSPKHPQNADADDKAQPLPFPFLSLRNYEEDKAPPLIYSSKVFAFKTKSKSA
jgi:hypothetical protein